MAFTYLYSTISALPAGYDCNIVLPVARLAGRLMDGNGVVSCRFKVFVEGDVRFEAEERLEFANDRLVGKAPAPFVWRDPGDAWGGHPGFLDLAVESADKREIFRTKAVMGFYSIYTKPGKKSFFSDNAYKFGSPPTIRQIAAYGQYVDAYPVIHLDRERDLGQSLTLINPYKKPVLAEIRTQDGRRLPRTRVPPLSARSVRLDALLRDDERVWMGQMQLTANNRLVTYIVQHSLRDPHVISDHEHLDPFRGDPTHVAAFRKLRLAAGRLLRR